MQVTCHGEVDRPDWVQRPGEQRVHVAPHDGAQALQRGVVLCGGIEERAQAAAAAAMFDLMQKLIGIKSSKTNCNIIQRSCPKPKGQDHILQKAIEAN